MKKLLIAFVVVAAMTAGYAEETKKRDALDIRPEAAVGAAKTGVEWENDPANEAALKAATTDDALAAIVKDEASAKKLLAQVKGAYKSDSLALRQIAAVSQYVMRPACCKDGVCTLPKADCAGARKIWACALADTAEKSSDSYVKMFCLDQLRWCGCAKIAPRVAEIGAKSGDKAVKDFSDMIVRELSGKAIGL